MIDLNVLESRPASIVVNPDPENLVSLNVKRSRVKTIEQNGLAHTA